MKTDTLYHLHVMRTAGSRIRGVIRESGTPITDDGTHIPLTAPPDRLTFVVVRNPFDWYVSRWAFRNQRKLAVGEERQDIDNLTFPEHMRRLMDAYSCGLSIYCGGATYFRETLTGHHRWMCGGVLVPEGVRVVRFEHLADGIVPILTEALGVTEAWAKDRMGKRANASEHGAWQSHFTPETIEWVRWVDREYFKTFGYSDGTTPKEKKHGEAQTDSEASTESSTEREPAGRTGNHARKRHGAAKASR